VVPLQNFATGVIAEVIRRQPSSPERTSFAWQLAVGPALARSTRVELREGILTVHTRDTRWPPEIKRSADTILGRLQHLLGQTAVTRIEID
jgi:predicted nucleic acid-binding Zn ribbon protein